MNTNLVAIDLAKNVFQVGLFNQACKVQSNKKVTRKKLRQTIRQIEPTTIVMEACYSAHYWGREFEKMGHVVKLIPAQHVKPFVVGNKNDANDVVAIAEASRRPKIRFVPVKTVYQQDIQMLHRIRSRHVSQRTALVNQIRGLLSEYGVVVALGWRKLCAALPDILEDGENDLSTYGRMMLAQLSDELTAINDIVKNDEKILASLVESDEDYQRLLKAPGFGQILTSAAVSSIGNGAQFTSGRQTAAWLGLTPGSMASGEKSVSKGITKRGNRYLRTLFIHGARAILNWAIKKDKTDTLSLWIKQLDARIGRNKTVVALAHKMVRIAWAILSKKEEYKPA